ncbi:MAG: 5'-methylthioadenosine/S-adenosylhomocysteine nucleosidase, partial [Candidatus Baumannia cicadellinicola]|nr:5'-methylthioadenosine/S-adenosylhomocysteine nucleosidase [Candidatus Baumannia cicadellinicola]
SAALGCTLLLTNFEATLVINIGSAGGLSPALAVGDIIVSEEVQYHDVNVTAFGYDKGQMAQYPLLFPASPSLVALTKQLTEHTNINVVCGQIISGDIFINGGQELYKLKRRFPQAIAVDMEVTAIAQICYLFAVPFVGIRVITDIADSVSHKSFKDNLITVVSHLSLLVSDIIQAL